MIKLRLLSYVILGLLAIMSATAATFSVIEWNQARTRGRRSGMLSALFWIAVTVGAIYAIARTGGRAN